MKIKHISWRVWLTLIALLAFGAASASCSSGGKGGAADKSASGASSKSDGAQRSARKAAGMATMIPAKADIAVIVPSWDEMRAGLKVSKKKFGDNPFNEIFESLEQGGAKQGGLMGGVAKSMKGETGLENQGVETSAALGAMYIDEVLLLMMTIKDEDKFNDALKKDAKENKAFSNKIHSKTVSGTKVRYILNDGEEKPGKDNIAGAWYVKDKVAVLFVRNEGFNEADPRPIFKDLLKLKSSRSLAKSKPYKSIRATLGDDHQLYAFINTPEMLEVLAKANPSDKAAYDMVGAVSDWTGIGVRIDQKGMDVKMLAMGQEAFVKALSRSMKARSDFSAVSGSIDKRPAFIIKVALNAQKLITELGKADPNIKAAIDGALKGARRDTGLDVKKDLLPALDGNVIIATYGGEPGQLLAGDFPALLTDGEASVTVGLKDAEAFKEALGKVFSKRGLKGQDTKGVTLYAFGKRDQDLALAVGAKSAVLAANGLGEDTLLKLAAGKGAGLKGLYTRGLAKELLSGKDGTGVAVDVARILKTLGDDVADSDEAKAIEALASWVVMTRPSDKGLETEIEVKFK